MNALDILKQLPVTADEVDLFYDILKEEILDNGADILKLMMHIKGIEKVISMLKDDVDIMGYMIMQFSYYGEKRVKLGDFTLEECEAGTTYDYSICNDKYYEYLEKELKKRREELKLGIVLDEDTNTPLALPGKKSTTTIKFTLNRKKNEK